MRAFAICVGFLGLLVSRPPAQAGAQERLVPVTLTPKVRLALPFLRVPVGPELSWVLKGRESPVFFKQVGEELRADVTAAEGFETLIKPGKPVRIEMGPGEEGGKPRERHAVFLKGDPKRGEPAWSVVMLTAWRGRIGRTPVTFVDHDADGAFLTEFHDFMVRSGRHLFPVSPSVVVGRSVFRVTYGEDAYESESRWLRWQPDDGFVTKDVFPQWNDVVKGLEHINAIRRDMNLPPFGLHRTASAHAMLHVRYCVLNGYFGHHQDPEKRGYTDEGAMAGMNSIGSGAGNVKAAINEFLTTLLHRMPLITPLVCEIGVGTDGSMVWIETASGAKRSWDEQGPVIFPGPQQSWMRSLFATERPDPRPEGAGAVGLPVTCAWYGGEEFSSVTATLRQGRTAVACYRHDADTREIRHLADAEVKVCLMPREALGFKPYVLDLQWAVEGFDGGTKTYRILYRFRIGRR